MLARAAAEKTRAGTGWVWLLSQPGQHMATLCRRSSPTPDTVQSDFGSHWTTGRENLPGKCYCYYLSTPPSTFLWWLVPLHAARKAWIWYQQEENHKLEQVEHWVAASHRASHTSCRSLRDRDASTRQPTLSLLSGGPPARPGILHSNLQQTTARGVIRWSECFQCWRGKVAPKR